MTDCVLLIHDDQNLLRALSARLEQAGSQVFRETSADTGLKVLDQARPDVVCLGVHLAAPGLVEKFAGRDAAVLAFGNGIDPALAARVMSAGVSRVVDPGNDADLFASLVRQSAVEARRRRISETIIRGGAPSYGLESLGTSPAMRQLSQQIGLLAQNERTTLLITGETGVGKAWAARIIHDRGARAGKPFLELRLTGQQPGYLESLIFGHEKGAFIEATERRHGLLELADGGTLLLREIGELPVELQPKLLRVLETKTFRRVGGTHDIGVDTRLIVTTRRDLTPDVESERFQKDLFYRLSVMPLGLPPLRERSNDDRLAIYHAVHQEARALYPEGPQVIAPDVIGRFQDYGWPGNLREMRCVIERAMVLARGQLAIGVEHLPGEFRARPGLGDRRHTPMSLEDLEKQHIERTLRYHGGNRTRAAKELGISRATLINKIKLYQIPA
ncbi:MAG: sigma-54-dependent transcriptional regulator [Gemmatimonadales bacterium]